tara:strand:- start:84 stop:563 length:480 start_codon:yes stop_codon:yes gene_type:complete
VKPKSFGAFGVACLREEEESWHKPKSSIFGSLEIVKSVAKSLCRLHRNNSTVGLNVFRSIIENKPNLRKGKREQKMAKVLSEFPHENAAGRPSVYPWDQWLDGQPWMLTIGEDYKTTTRQFRGAAEAAARRKGLWIRGAVQQNGIVIQAYTKEGRVPLT